MKRRERHHLKQNPVADFVLVAQRYLDAHARYITTIAVVVAVAAVAALAVFFVRQQTASRADALLADAMVALNAEVAPPGASGDGDGGAPLAAQLNASATFATERAKLNAAIAPLQVAAETYPNTQAAIVARYHLGTAFAAQGRHDEALAAFDEVERRAGDRSLYGRMARLGRADTLLQAARYDEAITAWRDLAARGDSQVPPDAILMELARAHAAKGDTEEARRTLSEIVDGHPGSVYQAEARNRLANLPG